MKWVYPWIACLCALVACGGTTQGLVLPVAEASPNPAASRAVATCDADGLMQPSFYLEAVRRIALDQNSEARDAAGKVLALLGDPLGLQVLHEIVTADPTNLFALAALVLVGDVDARAQALAMIDTIDPLQVVMIAYGFVNAPDPRVTERLRNSTGQVDSVHEAFVAAALAAMGDGEAIAEVERRIAQTSHGSEVIAEAAAALEWGSARARSLLYEVLRDRNARDYSHAASGLGHVPLNGDLPLLIKARQHADNPFDLVWIDYAILRQCPP